MTVVASEEPGQEQGPVILSVLLSLGTIENPASDYAAVREKVCNALGTAPEHLEFFQLAPSSSSSQQQDTESSSRTSTPGSSHMGVRVKSEKMTLEYFKYLISENKRLRTKVEKTSEALSTLQVCAPPPPLPHPLPGVRVTGDGTLPGRSSFSGQDFFY